MSGGVEAAKERYDEKMQAQEEVEFKIRRRQGKAMKETSALFFFPLQSELLNHPDMAL